MAWLASLASAGIGASSGKAGNDANSKGNKQAAAEREKYYEEAKSNYKPYADSGLAAQDVVNQLLGLEGYRTPADRALREHLGAKPVLGDAGRVKKSADGLEGLIEQSEGASTLGDSLGGVTKWYKKKRNKRGVQQAANVAAKEAEYQTAIKSWDAKTKDLTAQRDLELQGYDQNAVTKSILERTPGYQFRYSLGETAANNSLAGRNMSQGGAAQKELTRYGQDYGSREYQNALANYGAAAGKGFDANAALANMASGEGTNLANLAISRGANNADYYSTLNNAGQSALSNYYTQRNRSSYQNKPVFDTNSPTSNSGYKPGQTLDEENYN